VKNLKYGSRHDDEHRQFMDLFHVFLGIHNKGRVYYIRDYQGLPPNNTSTETYYGYPGAFVFTIPVTSRFSVIALASSQPAIENSREAAPEQKPRYPAPFFSASLISGPDQIARFQMFQKFCNVLLDLYTGYLEFLFEGGGNLVGRILFL
jgi:hypothetical protein